MYDTEAFISSVLGLHTGRAESRVRTFFSIAERIKDILKSWNLTQKELARRLGKRESEISRWLTGRHNFTTQTIARIETALGCKVITVL